MPTEHQGPNQGPESTLVQEPQIQPEHSTREQQKTQTDASSQATIKGIRDALNQIELKAHEPEEGSPKSEHPTHPLPIDKGSEKQTSSEYINKLGKRTINDLRSGDDGGVIHNLIESLNHGQQN